MSIKLKNINCFYGTKQSLFDINLTCNTGETLILLGPSGAGKSSLLYVLNLLEIPCNGQLNIAGNNFDFSQKPNKKTIHLLRKNVGIVFQQYNLWPHLTVQQNLTEAPCRVLKLTRTNANFLADKLLERLRIKDVSNRFPLHISIGQQQIVAIARALMMKPKILLFDEPTSALDPETTDHIIDIICELSKTGITQVIVTHEVKIIKRIATSIAYMENGSIIEQGNIEIFDHPRTKRLAKYLSYK